MPAKNVMHQYMLQEPELLLELLRSQEAEAAASVAFDSIKKLVIVGHGSSYNAARTIGPLFQRWAGIAVEVFLPDPLLWGDRPVNLGPVGETLVLAISQTGTSRGVLDLAMEIRKAGYGALALSEHQSTELALACDYAVALGCGPEDSNAKTKGYVCTLYALLKLAMGAAAKRRILSPARMESIGRQMRQMIDQILPVMEGVDLWLDQSGFYQDVNHVFFLGDGLNFGTALEGQLKLMETLCLPTMVSDYTEFSHGMHRAVKKDSHLVLLNSGGAYSNRMGEILTYLNQITPHVLLLDSSGQAPAHDAVIQLPAFDELESLLLHTTALHTLAASIPYKLGMDPNAPANDDFTRLMGTRGHASPSPGDVSKKERA